MSEIFTPRNGDDPSDGSPRLVLDTNTVLALWMFRDPKLERLRAWIEAGKCRVFSREDALEELRRVLAYRQFGLEQAAQSNLFTIYRGHVICLAADPDAPAYSLPLCGDTDDQKYLEIAYDSSADFLLTRDKALLYTGRKERIRRQFAVLTPEHYLHLQETE